MADKSAQCHFYWKGPFSQWQYAEFELDGVHFCYAEQAMMYHKALLFEDTEIAGAILEAVKPGEQKALGRDVRGFNEQKWSENRKRIVRAINNAKFSQSKRLRRELFHTVTK